MTRKLRRPLKSSCRYSDDLGCQLEAAAPDFHDAYDIFQTLRAWSFELSFAERFAEFGEEQFKETIRWNVAQGQTLDWRGYQPH